MGVEMLPFQPSSVALDPSDCGRRGRKSGHLRHCQETISIGSTKTEGVGSCRCHRTVIEDLTTVNLVSPTSNDERPGVRFGAGQNSDEDGKFRRKLIGYLERYVCFLDSEVLINPKVILKAPAQKCRFGYDAIPA